MRLAPTRAVARGCRHRALGLGKPFAGGVVTAAALAFAACQGEPVDTGGDSDESTDERSGDTDVEPPLPDCEPPLSLAPAEATGYVCWRLVSALA